MERYLLAAIDVNVSIAYFWLNEGAHQLSYSVYSLLDSIKDEITDASALDRIEGLGSDIEVMNKSEKASGAKVINLTENIMELHTPKIPEGYSTTLELKILWITLESILNLFNYGAYELAFMMLMEISEEWNLVYQLIIPNLKKTPMIEPLKDWSKMHLYFAIDLYGELFLEELLEEKEGF